jgi:hypothetical protein
MAFTPTGRFTNSTNYNSGSGRGLFGHVYDIGKKVAGIADESESAKEQRANLNNQGGMASEFADIGQQNYGQLTAEAAALREAMRRRASGQDSLSAEQLRQGLQQQVAQQRSMAAGAAPQNAAMASRNAMNNMARASAGMSGNAAMAGIQERAAAEKALADLMIQQRGQDVNVALGSRQNAISGFGGVKPEGSLLDKWGPAFAAVPGMFANSGGGKK